MVKRVDTNMGADAMRAATGRDHRQWRDLLQAAGALAWSHAEIARWLVAEHGIDGWWAQGITVDFEQDRKGRLPGQQADGTFAVSMTRTVPGERLAALAEVRAAVEAVHGDAHGENLAAAQPPKASGTPITLTAEKLADAAAMESARSELAAIFAAARA